MELNIITVAIITGFIIIYTTSLITYLILLGLEWRNEDKVTDFQDKITLFFLGLSAFIPFVNTFILLYHFFYRPSK